MELKSKNKLLIYLKSINKISFELFDKLIFFFKKVDSNILIPYTFKVDNINTSNVYNNGNLIVPAGSYNVLYETKTNVGGYYKSNKVGFCYGMRYYQLMSNRVLGYTYQLELGSRPSVLQNNAYYTRGLRSFPIYFELGIGLLLSSIK